MKKQIPFDFALWGKEGISVEVKLGYITSVQAITLHSNEIDNTFYGVYGKNSLFNVNKDKLTMYREVEEVNPREIWMNEYGDGLSGGYHSKEAAKWNAAPDCIGQVKFREVLNEE